MNNFKNIHIGSEIERLVKLKKLSVSRVCLYLNCSSKDIEFMYKQESLDSKILLKWCKLLEYNLFMFYHSHLQLYSPKSTKTKVGSDELKNKREEDLFRKNLYSEDLKVWILEKWNSKELTAKEIIEKYQIPRTTLYRWRRKHPDFIKTNTRDTSSKKKVNYKLLYIDFIKENKTIPQSLKRELLDHINQWSSCNISYAELYNVEARLKSGNAGYKDQSNVHLKSYDKQFIQQVLKDQEKNNLSNRLLSFKYKLSRNTVSRWRKTYNR